MQHQRSNVLGGGLSGVDVQVYVQDGAWRFFFGGWVGGLLFFALVASCP